MYMVQSLTDSVQVDAASAGSPPSADGGEAMVSNNGLLDIVDSGEDGRTS